MNLDVALQGRRAELEVARGVVDAYDAAKARASVDGSDINREALFQAERSVIRMVSSLSGHTLAGKQFNATLFHEGTRNFVINPGGSVDASQLIEYFHGGGVEPPKLVHVSAPRPGATATAPKPRAAATPAPAKLSVDPALDVNIDAMLEDSPDAIEDVRKVIWRYDQIKRAAAANWSALNRSAMHEAERIVINVAEQLANASLEDGKAFAMRLNLGGERRFMVLPAGGSPQTSWLLEFRAGERVHVGPPLGERQIRPKK